MLAVAPEGLTGRAQPRLAPPRPLRVDISEFQRAADDLGIAPMEWQLIAASYLDARGPSSWLFPECAVVAARQNGKTTLLAPHILRRLRMGRRILHTAQNREIPRETFEYLADHLQSTGELLRKGGIRWANGQEVIKFRNGGVYRLVAPLSGVRGHHADDVIQDETREQRDERLRKAMLPTLTAAPDPQTVYMSNAGDDESVILNSLRDRRDSPNLAYLEWSADPERRIDDEEGWAEANPALGTTITLERLRQFRESLSDAAFETEHLCRWVDSMRDRLVDADAWIDCAADALQRPLGRKYVGVSMAPEGTRATAVMAYQQPDGTVALRVVLDVAGDPIDLQAFGQELMTLAGGAKVGYDPMTDSQLAKFVRVSAKINGAEFANASALFVSLVDGRVIRYRDADAVTNDLVWTARKEHDETGSFQAVRIDDDRPVTAALAAIRAVWLASGPKARKLRLY